MDMLGAESFTICERALREGVRMWIGCWFTA